MGKIRLVFTIPLVSILVLVPRGSYSKVAIRYSVFKGGMKAVHVEEGSTLEWGSGIITTDPSKVQFFRLQVESQTSPDTDR